MHNIKEGKNLKKMREIMKNKWKDINKMPKRICMF